MSRWRVLFRFNRRLTVRLTNAPSLPPPYLALTYPSVPVSHSTITHMRSKRPPQELSPEHIFLAHRLIGLNVLVKVESTDFWLQLKQSGKQP